MRIVDDIKDGDAAVLICMRVADVPIPSTPAAIVICQGGCLERVWRSLASPQNTRIICTQCATRQLAGVPDPQWTVTRAQLAEVLRHAKTQK